MADSRHIGFGTGRKREGEGDTWRRLRGRRTDRSNGKRRTRHDGKMTGRGWDGTRRRWKADCGRRGTEHIIKILLPANSQFSMRLLTKSWVPCRKASAEWVHVKSWTQIAHEDVSRDCSNRSVTLQRISGTAGQTSHDYTFITGRIKTVAIRTDNSDCRLEKIYSRQSLLTVRMSVQFEFVCRYDDV